MYFDLGWTSPRFDSNASQRFLGSLGCESVEIVLLKKLLLGHVSRHDLSSCFPKELSEDMTLNLVLPEITANSERPTNPLGRSS